MDGDHKSKFFHQPANKKRKFNAIRKIKVDAEPYVDASAVKCNCSFL